MAQRAFVIACVLLNVGCRTTPTTVDASESARTVHVVADDAPTPMAESVRVRAAPEGSEKPRVYRMTPCSDHPSTCPPGYVCSTDPRLGCFTSGCSGGHCLPNCNGGLCVTPQRIEALDKQGPAYRPLDDRDNPWL